jgi:hypothetical protein
VNEGNELSEEPKRIRIPSEDTFERKRLEGLGYFIESGDGQHLVMRLDRPAGVAGTVGLSHIHDKSTA